ncbi:MAG: hypothetical protein ACYDDQ_11020 [Vulcanimicrobiaceae bacterium]
MKMRSLAIAAALFAYGAATVQAAPAGTNPCGVVTRADASAALGVQALPGFAIGATRTNVSLGGRITGPKISCRYRSSVGEVFVTVHAYGDPKTAYAAYERDRKNWWPREDLSGIGDAAFYNRGGQIYARKGADELFVSLTFKKSISPLSADPRLIALAKKAASRL